MLLHSINDEHMHAKLEEPTPNEECPMTLEPIATYELECTAGLAIIPTSPRKTKLTLPCGHGFSAIACLYYFAKKEMKCPLCRYGFDSRMSPTSLPVHLTERIMQHVTQQWNEDQVEEESDNFQTSISIMMMDLQDSFITFHDNHTIILVVYCYDEDDELVPVVSFDLEMKSTVVRDNIQFMLSRSSLRSLSTNIRQCSPLKIVQFAIGIRCAQRDFMFLDRSSKISIDSLGTARTIPGQRTSEFCIEGVLGDGLSFLDLKWSISTNGFSAVVQRQRNMLFL